MYIYISYHFHFSSKYSKDWNIACIIIGISYVFHRFYRHVKKTNSTVFKQCYVSLLKAFILYTHRNISLIHQKGETSIRHTRSSLHVFFFFSQDISARHFSRRSFIVSASLLVITFFPGNRESRWRYTCTHTHTHRSAANFSCLLKENDPRMNGVKCEEEKAKREREIFKIDIAAKHALF